jgi:hypothetical protein
MQFGINVYYKLNQNKVPFKSSELTGVYAEKTNHFTLSWIQKLDTGSGLVVAFIEQV